MRYSHMWKKICKQKGERKRERKKERERGGKRGNIYLKKWRGKKKGIDCYKMKIFGVAVQTGAQFYGVSSGIKEGVRTYTHTQTSVRWDSVESITQIFFKTFA